MNLKTVLFNTLIIAILCTICVEARNKKKTVTHHSESGHNKRGSGSGQHNADSIHRRSPDNHPKQTTRKTNTTHAANHHIDSLHSPYQSVVNTHTNTSHGPNQAIANQPTDTSHNPNQVIANHHTDTSHIPNQPVYIVQVQQQSSHSSGNDDFEAGYDAGVATARRMLKRTTTTTTTTVAPKTTTSTPITTKNQCLSEAPMPGIAHYSSSDSYPHQQTHNPYNGEVANPPLYGLQNPNQVGYDVNLQHQNVHAFGNNPNNRDVSNLPSDPNQPAYFVNLQQQNPHASGNGPMPKYNQPQQQNAIVNCGLISPSTESINMLNTSVNDIGLE